MATWRYGTDTSCLARSSRSIPDIAQYDQDMTKNIGCQTIFARANNWWRHTVATLTFREPASTSTIPLVHSTFDSK